MTIMNPTTIIPPFFFPHGQPISHIEQEQKLRKILAIVKHLYGYRQFLLESHFIAVTKTCGLSRYMNFALFKKMVPIGDYITFSQFVTAWTDISKDNYDDESLYYNIIKKSNVNYICPEDFLPILEDVVLHHPGLQFLSDNIMFQERYIETVICRIFYDADCYNGKMTLRQFRKSRFVESIKSLSCFTEVNNTNDCFSYKHFYVLYCKFWSLDQDHDLLITASDLQNYNDQCLSPKIISRIMQVGKVAAFHCDTSTTTTTASTSNNSDTDLHSTRNTNPTFSYLDFIWFLLNEVDKTTPKSIEYWFRCLDEDGDGIITSYDLENYWQIQMTRHLSSSTPSTSSSSATNSNNNYLDKNHDTHSLQEDEDDKIKFDDIIRQMNDLIQPEIPGQFRLKDLKKNGISAERFFDTFLHFDKLHVHESCQGSIRLKLQHERAMYQQQLQLYDASVSASPNGQAMDHSFLLNYLDDISYYFALCDWNEYAEVEYRQLIMLENQRFVNNNCISDYDQDNDEDIEEEEEEDDHDEDDEDEEEDDELTDEEDDHENNIQDSNNNTNNSNNHTSPIYNLSTVQKQPIYFNSMEYNNNSNNNNYNNNIINHHKNQQQQHISYDYTSTFEFTDIVDKIHTSLQKLDHHQNELLDQQRSINDNVLTMFKPTPNTTNNILTTTHCNNNNNSSHGDQENGIGYFNLNKKNHSYSSFNIDNKQKEENEEENQEDDDKDSVYKIRSSLDKLDQHQDEFLNQRFSHSLRSTTTPNLHDNKRMDQKEEKEKEKEKEKDYALMNQSQLSPTIVAETDFEDDMDSVYKIRLSLDKLDKHQKEFLNQRFSNPLRPSKTTSSLHDKSIRMDQEEKEQLQQYYTSANHDNEDNDDIMNKIRTSLEKLDKNQNEYINQRFTQPKSLVSYESLFDQHQGNDDEEGSEESEESEIDNSPTTPLDDPSTSTASSSSTTIHHHHTSSSSTSSSSSLPRSTSSTSLSYPWHMGKNKMEDNNSFMESDLVQQQQQEKKNKTHQGKDRFWWLSKQKVLNQINHF
ncbi:unnamed protein product [Cunninghamella echinulata]